MGKRIRHLEFYGYPDQNVFTSLGSVDLSEINKINQEQDEEISELSGATKGKADLYIVNELSAKTDTFINLQGEINNNLASAISGNTERIAALEQYDEEMTDTINDIISNMTSLDDDVDALSGEVETLKGLIVDASAVTESIDALSGAIDDLRDVVDGKLDKTEAEETYAKKVDVYTKEECDEKFLTEHQSLSSITEDIEALSGSIDTLQEEIDAIPIIDESKFALKVDLEELSGTFETYTASTDGKFDSIEDEISAISGDVSNLSNRVNAIDDNIEEINVELSKKVDKRVFSAFTSDVEDALDLLNRNKADKTELRELSGTVQQLQSDLQQEVTDRENADNTLQGNIDTVDGKVYTLSGEISDISDAIDDLGDRLDQEIRDRKAGDIALIGTSADSMNADTIWGAKKYAVNQRTIAITSAITYTDEKYSDIESEIANKFDEINTKLAKKASKKYVNDTVDDKVGELKDDLTNQLEIEEGTRKNVDAHLQSEIDDLNDFIYSGWSADTQHIYNRLNVITTYTGDSVDHYTNDGNGVLDVLHREFHEFEQHAGAIKEIRVEDGNLIIVYYTKEGEKEAVVPVGELIDLSDYYTKEETDEKIANKVDTSAFTEAVDDLNGKIDAEIARATSAETELEESISATTSALDALINRLGYTDNETLQRNGEREVAFGQYNISNTSEDASGKTIFSVGNGTDDANRSNAIEIRENGDVYMWVEGDFMNVNRLLAQIAHEIYDANSGNNPHFFDGE